LGFDFEGVLIALKGWCYIVAWSSGRLGKRGILELATEWSHEFGVEYFEIKFWGLTDSDMGAHFFLPRLVWGFENEGITGLSRSRVFDFRQCMILFTQYAKALSVI